MLAIQVVKDENAPPVALLSVLIMKYGVEALEWEPELRRKDLEQDYDFEMSDLQADKLNAAITVLKTNMFETQWNVFETCSHFFNNNYTSFEDLDPLQPEELIIGAAHAVVIRGEKLLYDDEVNLYAGQIFKDHGFCAPPKLFPTAIMSVKNPDGDDTFKNELLQEAFDAHMQRIATYMSKLHL